MRWMPEGKRLVELLLAGLLLTGMTMVPRCVLTAQTSTVATTQVTDTVYRADGTTATGTVLINWPAFTTSNGLSVAAGNTSATIATGGALSVALAPNAGSSPMGSYYTAVYHLDDGTVSREYWVVPVSATPVLVSAIKSTVMPTSVALQTVTKNYVDTAIAEAISGGTISDGAPYVLKAGDTMTGPLVLPADPVSPTQAADKHYVDVNIAAAGGGGTGKVTLNPTASQVVAQPTGTDLSVNLLNGVEYASQYPTGTGNNGIANAAASTDCASGCEIKADESYPATEVPHLGGWTSGTELEDTRKGARFETSLNPENLYHPGIETGHSIDVQSTRSGAVLKALTGTNSPASLSLQVSNEGLGGGSNLFPQSIEGTVPYFKSGYSALSVTGTYNAQGQHVLVPRKINCYGVGDCLIGSEYITASGGFRDEADEGAHPMDIQILEDSQVFAATCTAGCTAGSTSLVVTPTSAAGTQGEGRFLIDRNTANVLSTGTLTGGTFGTPHATATFTGTSFPVSTFFATGQMIPSQASNIAPGTVTFVIATTGLPTGYATNTAAAPSTSGVACVVDRPNSAAPSNYEMAPYTVVDGTHLQMTLNKVHNTLATIAMGGLCGYGLEQTVDTQGGIRQLFPVVGAYSSTGLYYAGSAAAVVGRSAETSAYLNASVSIASLARTGNLVTVTTAGNLPFDLNGLPLTIAGATDSSYNGTYTVTTIGSASFTYAQTGANSTSSGGTVSYVTGGFALYPMAEVLSVLDAATNTVDGAMTLAPNSVAFAAGDALEQPHFYQQSVRGDVTYVSQTTPRPTSATASGIFYEGNNGPGVQGWIISNTSPASNYFGNGGTHLAPDFAYEASGVWQTTMVAQAGETSVFNINCNSHGCAKWNSPFALFELQSSAGTDTIQWQPGTSSLVYNLRGTPYSFTPSGFNAGTINATTVNASAVTGVTASSITTGTFAPALLPLFGASGTSHAAGAVPDPGATAGTTRYLREDGSWNAPPGGGGATGAASITSGTINGTAIGGSTPAAGAFTTVTAGTAIAAASGGTGSAVAPAAGQVLVGNVGGTGYAPQTMSGDCALGSGGAVTCTKTNGVTFGSAATTAATAYDTAGAAAAAQAASVPNTQTGVIAALGYTPAVGANFTTDFMACYLFTESASASGSLVDHCGTNTGTVGTTSPTSTGLGWQFTITTSAVTLPSALNTAKTFYFAVLAPAASGGGWTQPPGDNLLLGSTLTTGGLNIMGEAPAGTGQTFSGFGTLSSGYISQASDLVSGVTIWTLVCGVSGTATDAIYLNGVRVAAMAHTGSSCNLQTSGNFQLGKSGQNSNWQSVNTYYDLRVSGSQHTAAQVQQNVAAMQNELSTRGISTTPPTYRYPVQQLFFAGDSITCGYTITGGTSQCITGSPYAPGTVSSLAFPNILSLNQTFGITNFGVPNALVQQQVAAGPFLYTPLCSGQSGKNIAVLFEGTNNFSSTINAVPLTVWQLAVAWAAQQRAAGCKTVFMNMISRGGTGGGSTTFDSWKSQYNLLSRAGWGGVFDDYIDLEADTSMGCNGCATNTTYFYTDQTHPSAAGQVKLAAAVSAHINALAAGSSPGNPNPTIVTAATYTSTVVDGGLIFNTASNSIADTLFSAQWFTGRTISRCNNSTSGSNTLTIDAPSDYPFNNISGSTAITVANGTCLKLQSTFVAGATNGDYWRVVQ